MDHKPNYNLFKEFLEAYKGQDFININPNDSLVVELEQQLQKTGQFFLIADMIKAQIVYCSEGCHKFYGIKKDELDPSLILERTHPDDIKRHGTARGNVFKTSLDMFNEPTGDLFVSSNLRTLNSKNKYVELLFQLRLIYSESPRKTVYNIQVNTDVGHMIDIKHGYHYYFGHDESHFRYPDPALLALGNIFSDREFEILKCISQGMDSSEIAAKLFLSIHTVNTHRRNILEKSGKRNTHELVIELQDRGVL